MLRILAREGLESEAESESEMKERTGWEASIWVRREVCKGASVEM